MVITNGLEINTDLEKVLDVLIADVHKAHLTYFGRGYKHTPDYLMVQCPYHKSGGETKPSAQFRKTDGLFFCHACKETKSLAGVITDVLGQDGKAWLAENFDATAGAHSRLPVRSLKIEAKKPKTYPESALNAFNQKHPYMYERKLTDEIIAKFKIGYSPEKNCIVFPIRDADGNLIAAATRSVDKKEFHYPSGVGKPLYGLYEILREMEQGKVVDEVYICESILDALVIWRYGKYAVAMNGTGTKQQYEELRNAPFRKYILATDNDAAGMKSRMDLRAHVTNKFIYEIDYKSYGTCKDINDFEEEQFLNANIILCSPLHK